MIQNQHPVDLLPGYALSVLDDGDASLVRAHVQECPACQRELQQIVAELGDGGQMVPRARVRRQLFAHIHFDMDMREALREGARRTSLRWVWGAFLLISGSIVASLLMWSGMQQRELLANERMPVTVFEQNAAIVQFLAQSDVMGYQLERKQATISASMRMYHHAATQQMLFTAIGLEQSQIYVVWLIDDVRAMRIGNVVPDASGVGWLRTQVQSMCVRCNILVTRERDITPREPSRDWQFELIFMRQE